LVSGRAYAGSTPEKHARVSGSYFVYVGAYAAPAKSKGIYLFRFDTETAHFTPLGLAAELRNPRWMTTDPQHRFLYATEEVGNNSGMNGTISSYLLDPATGALKFLNKVSSEGGNPAYLAIDSTDKMLLTANYLSGSVLSWAINPDGSIGEKTGFDQHTGSSVDARRQEGPHPHSVVISPDNRFLFAPDLGLDKIFIYRLNSAKATFVPNDPAFVSVPSGLGPRHLAFGPGAKFAYLVCEMGARVVVFSYDKSAGSLKIVQIISTLPSDFTGAATSAEIEVDKSGRFLYASTRGNDSITVFGIDPKNGTLTNIQVEPTQGQTPRTFAIDPSGRYLVAANQSTDNMVTFAIDQSTGKLAPTGDVIKISVPVGIVFVPAP
jgi:6-phosphogluconolactonase